MQYKGKLNLLAGSLNVRLGSQGFTFSNNLHVNWQTISYGEPFLFYTQFNGKHLWEKIDAGDENSINNSMGNCVDELELIWMIIRIGLDLFFCRFYLKILIECVFLEVEVIDI